ncbi:MAG TPA: hypothetical protein VFQ47_06165 [Nitrososphaera sp.]|nr:hypothetical protein [Nitrososphaera sp.]
MRLLSIKISLTLITFLAGIAVTSIWHNYGQPLIEKLDGLVVDTGASLLGRLSTTPGTSASIQTQISPYEAGRIEAAQDIQDGKLRVKSLGMLTVVHSIYADKLMRDYRIEFIDYGCVGTEEFTERIRGYNEVSRASIEQQYGEGFLKREFERTKEEYIRSYKLR